MKKGTVSNVLAGLLVFGVGFFWLRDHNINSAKEPPEEDTRQMVRTTWDQLVSEYRENELAFNDKYKNAEFMMDGTVGNIADSVIGPNITVASPSGVPFSAIFSREQEGQLKGLHTGDHITFRCESFELATQMDDCIYSGTVADTNNREDVTPP